MSAAKGTPTTDFDLLFDHNGCELCFDGVSIVVDSGVFAPHYDLTNSTYQILGIFPPVSSKSVLDVGTGSGILAIMSGLHGASRVDAIDICPLAVHNARQNAFRNGVDMNVSQSNLFESVADSYDVIFANLPIYYGSYKSDSLNVIEVFLKNASNHLSDHGTIYMSWFSIIDTDYIKCIICKYGYKFIEHTETRLGYIWSVFEIKKEWV